MATNQKRVHRYGGRLPRAVVGQIADTSARDIISLVNSYPRTAQVETVTVDTAADSTAYTVTINGVVVTVTSAASGDTETTIAAKLALAINNEVAVSAAVFAESSAAVIAITARIAGEGFVFAETDSRLSTAATTANDLADGIAFGRVVMTEGTGCRVADSTGLSAKTVVLTPTAANATLYSVVVTYDGIGYSALFTSDADATAQEIATGLAAAVNAVVPASTVLADATSAVLTLTAEVVGADFGVGHGANLAITSSTGDVITSRLVGVAIRSHAQAHESAGYAGDQTVSVMTLGRVYVEPEDTLTSTSQPVFVRLGTGEKGALRGSPATGFVRAPASWRWRELLDDGFAVLEVNR